MTLPVPRPPLGLVYVTEEELGGWRRPRPPVRELVPDLLCAIGLYALLMLSCWLGQRAGDWPREPASLGVSMAWGAALCAPLVWRRRHPVAVLIVVSAILGVCYALVIPDNLICILVLYLAYYTVGAWAADRLLGVVVRVLVALAWVGLFAVSFAQGGGLLMWDISMLSREGSFSPFHAYATSYMLLTVLYFCLGFFFGEMGYRWALRLAVLRRREADLQDERDRSAAQALALERLRIARELHDAVAHHVSVMGLQAGAARLLMGSDAEGARAALGTVEESARSAIDELQGLLLTLRDHPDTPAREASSTRSVDGIPDLVDQSRAAGTPTQLTTIGAPVQVSAAVSLTAYRVVQEALTNVRKHAGPAATADVRLRYLPGELEIDVIDTGRGPRPHRGPRRPGSAMGILGMRERVAAVGGTLEAGRSDAGGFRVRVSLPTQGEPAGLSLAVTEVR